MGDNPSKFKGEQLPVETIRWEDAVSFCKKLSELPEEESAERVYRLPTEAEWEYACRASSTTTYCFGDSTETLGEYGWFGDVTGRSHPGGNKKANRWGIFDMHGNVWEWCQDWHDEYSTDNATDPRGPKHGSRRIARGGGWDSHIDLCNSSSRLWLLPYFPYHVGFRVAMTLPAKQAKSASSK